jgi:hypothetical protein
VCMHMAVDHSLALAPQRACPPSRTATSAAVRLVMLPISGLIFIYTMICTIVHATPVHAHSYADTIVSLADRSDAAAGAHTWRGLNDAALNSTATLTDTIDANLLVWIIVPGVVLVTLCAMCILCIYVRHNRAPPKEVHGVDMLALGSTLHAQRKSLSDVEYAEQEAAANLETGTRSISRAYTTTGDGRTRSIAASHFIDNPLHDGGMAM